MIEEIQRRISVLNNKKLPVMTKRDLRGGMQKRVHRQEAQRYSNRVNCMRDTLQKQLASLQSEQDLSISTFSTGFELDDFNEPVFKKIRSKGGFFK